MTETLDSARNKLASKARAQRAIVDKPNSTDADWKRWDKLDEEFRDLHEWIKAEESGLNKVDPETRVPHLDSSQPPDPRQGMTLLGRGDSMADYVRRTRDVSDQQGLSLGKYVRGIVSGVWDGAPQERAMSTVLGSSGGYMVPQALAAQVIDQARNQSRLFQAGAQTYVMETGSVDFAKISGDPTGYWRSEGVEITTSDITLTQQMMTARTLAALVKFSRELAEDAVNLDSMVKTVLASVLALEIDRIGLYGDGAGEEPLGLLNWTGFDTQSMGTNGASLAGYDEILDTRLNVLNANYTPTGYVLAPRTDTEIEKLTDGEGNPLQMPAAVTNMTRLITKQVSITRTQGSATDASDVFVGQWDQLVFGIRAELGIEILRERYASSGEYAALAWTRVDVMPTEIDAFSALVGVIPPA